MKIYFYDSKYRYVGNRELQIDELIPDFATTEVAEVKDGEEAYLINEKWVVSKIIEESV